MEEEKVNNNVSEGSQSQPVTTPSIPVAMIAPTMNTGNHNGVTTTTATTTAVTTMTIPLDISGKKKRGRPRKYDSDGKLNVKYQSAKSAPAFTFSPTSPNRGSGRSFDSTNWLLFSPSFGEVFANSAGWDFTPFMVTVNTGQDVSGMIMSFAQKGPGGICIMSANGSVSNVALRQRDSAGGIVTYEALSLSLIYFFPSKC
ncbi:putative PPC domain, AT hook, DNA-binding protein [Lupinus albus]|uniref:AT-hook motif nuclear-localized protein n=1 Tax=Lupinus albus TaxID=3870 RepID=A0A6A4QEW9_LUPAL|nr:putative PPC domain, AT hook, DNA-binding protein [Lupinus albus]